MAQRVLTTCRLAPRLSPQGRLSLVPDEEAGEIEGELAERVLERFALGPGHGLLALGGAGVGRALPAPLAYWRDVGARFLSSLCALPDVQRRSARGNGALTVPPPSAEDLDRLAAAAPPMTGGEYLDAGVLEAIWRSTNDALNAALAGSNAPVEDFLRALGPHWHLVGRVHFHLAENRKDEAAPFAFLATYTTRLSSHGKPQHLPLGEALEENAGAKDKERLLSLLLPVKRAAEGCTWLAEMVSSGEIFHPLRWTPAEAVRFLADVPRLEQAGVVVRMPAAWKAGRPSRPQVTARLGDGPPSGLGMAAILDFDVGLTLDGERLSPAEVRALLAGADGLAFLRGQWVEVDRARLGRTLDRFREAERLAKTQGLTFADAMRLLAGAGVTGAPEDREEADWSRVVAGPWLAETLRALRAPEALARVEPGKDLRGSLRPYQEVGVRWLHFLAGLGLGSCLADDMGLGKTLEVIALLLARKRETVAPRRPNLLVAPASLLANWVAEIERFAPSLAALVLHPSAMAPEEWKALSLADVAGADLAITSYGTLLRLRALEGAEWDLVILDEAQAIKNPEAKQTRAAKRLRGRARIVLTGTPVENRLGDLWSIFDFLNPGLLGSPKEFASFARRLEAADGPGYAPLRDLVRPYVLRRLKTDRSVIADLPEKTEVKAYCALSRKQAALYQKSVEELAAGLKDADGMRRRGVILAFLMRFKQICNHPSQWLGDGGWAHEESGKFARLREIAEVVAAKQEKALVFTQFREVTAPLTAFLGEVFGRGGLVLHGGTPVRERSALVRRFQEDDAVPFFVLSLKAGGSGLNLTAASHVVHFDRWWNPAVENQATDRAFRIGQRKNVLVHKFVCRGTVEERIDDLIESKKALAQDLLEGGAEARLTELTDEALLRLVALDLRAAREE